MATPDDVEATRPDAVVLATGAAMVAPAWLPEEIREEGFVQSLPEGARKSDDAQAGPTGNRRDLRHGPL